MEQEILRYENKMKNCQSMTDLLVAMSSWNTFCEREGLGEAERKKVDSAYIEAEARLLANVKPSLW